jgi:hypothetical protein
VRGYDGDDGLDGTYDYDFVAVTFVAADLDYDGNVNQFDFGVLQQYLSVANISPDPDCADGWSIALWPLRGGENRPGGRLGCRAQAARSILLAQEGLM